VRGRTSRVGAYFAEKLLRVWREPSHRSRCDGCRRSWAAIHGGRPFFNKQARKQWPGGGRGRGSVLKKVAGTRDKGDGGPPGSPPSKRPGPGGRTPRGFPGLKSEAVSPAPGRLGPRIAPPGGPAKPRRPASRSRPRPRPSAHRTPAYLRGEPRGSARSS
jgi:hypothetical protein